MNALDLEKKLHNEIPLSKHMMVRVELATSNRVELTAELEPNHNHIGTAFGGSLCNLMILAAYCQIFNLIGAKGHVVIKTGTLHYYIPVDEKIRAVCCLPPESAVAEFLRVYEKKKKGKLLLESAVILSDGRTACSMSSEFVCV